MAQDILRPRDSGFHINRLESKSKQTLVTWNLFVFFGDLEYFA